MKKILEIKEGDWILAGDMEKLFPGITLKTIYNWRAKIKRGEANVNDYPKTKKLGPNIYVYRPSLIEFLNADDILEAS